MASSSSPDEFNTNFLGSDKVGVVMAQDLVASVAVGEAAEFAAKKAVWNVGGKTIIKKLDKIVISKALQSRISKMASQSALKVIRKLVNKLVTKILYKTAGKVAVSASTKAGAQAARTAATAGTVAATGCATTGLQTAGVGCAVATAGAAAYFMADMAFMIYNLVLDVQDKKGLNFIIHQDFIDNIDKSITDALNSGFADAGFPDYFDEEVLFYPEEFVFKYDDKGNLKIDPKWGPIYDKYVNEYITKLGYPSNWKDNLPTETYDQHEMDTKDVYSEVNSKTIKYNIFGFKFKIKRKYSYIYLISIIAVILLCLFILFLLLK